MANEASENGTRLHVVTGKGGTGKTTVAAALALALAAGGRTVLLCEVEGRQGIAQLFDVAPLPYEERQIAVAPGGGHLFALAIDPEAALLEYLQMYYKLGRAGATLDRFGVIDFATTIAPGLRDVLLTGKVYEAMKRRHPKRARTYDAVVLDAPPTGRIARFLNVNTEVAGLAKVGPISSQANSIMALLRSAETAVHVVTVLEDMPVQETVDALAELRKAALPVGAVVLNRVRDSSVPATSPRPEDIASALAAVGLAPDEVLVNQLLQEAAEQTERLALQADQRSIVEGLGRPTHELPQLSDGVDLGALYELAEDLREQGLA